jgi:hypothetical protein
MDKLVSSVDIVFKIALAVIAAVVSYQFGHFKQQNDDVKLVVELAFAPEPRTATAGVVLASGYAEQGRIPPELYASIVASANSSGNAQLRDTANNGADTVARTNEAVARQVTQALNTLPVRVYFQISREADRARAKRIAEALQAPGSSLGSASLVVPGIELKAGATTKTEVRCFKEDECTSLGGKLVDALEVFGVNAKLVDLSQRYGKSTSIRPLHFEIWFGPLT